MRVFVTGSGGHIGTAVVSELVRAGHSVVGLVRSDSSAQHVAGLGAAVVQGDVNDVERLRSLVEDVDAVVHLAYDHAAIAVGDLTTAADADVLVVRAFGDALADTGKTFIGIGFAPTGNPEIDRVLEANPRSAVAREVAALEGRGIRSLLMAIPPVTHSDRDRGGFIPTVIRIARDTKVSGYVDEGRNHWPAVHTLDLATLYRLALEKAPAGSRLHAVAEEGIPTRVIAEAIGRAFDVPVAAIPADRVQEHFGWIGGFFSGDMAGSSVATQRLLGWTPTGPTLVDDIDGGAYRPA